MVNVTRPEVERLIADGLDTPDSCRALVSAAGFCGYDEAWFGHHDPEYYRHHAFIAPLVRRLALALEAEAKKVDAVRAWAETAATFAYPRDGITDTGRMWRESTWNDTGKHVLAILDADALLAAKERPI